MFEDEFSALQADMVDICNEYSKGMADKIFIYAANEGMILVQHFYCINFNLYKCSKLNNAGVKVNFDTSDGCQEQVLDILNEDIQKIESVCNKYGQPVPKLMKLIYEPKTKKFNAEYTYENQTSLLMMFRYLIITTPGLKKSKGGLRRCRADKLLNSA